MSNALCYYCPIIAGAKEDDYVVDEALNKVIVEESLRDSKSQSTKTETEVSEENVKTAEAAAIGSISFVSCATGEDAMQTLTDTGATEPEEGW